VTPPEDKPSPAAKPGTERHRDEQRAYRGPVYHGGDWKDADEEADREALRVPAEEEVRSAVETADEEITDPGTRGAVLGRGGVGIVERDEDTSPDDQPKGESPGRPRR
jgi:hypothetical protein